MGLMSLKSRSPITQVKRWGNQGVQQSRTCHSSPLEWVIQ